MKETWRKVLVLGLTLMVCCLMLIACGENDPTLNSSNAAASSTNGAVSDTQDSTATTHIHSFGEWVETKSVTCTEDGEKVRYCDCGTVENETIKATGHTDGEWIIDADAMCTEDGSKHQICSVCNSTIKTETIPAVGHTDGEWIIDVAATCTEEGSKHHICSVCSSAIKIETIPATGHTDGAWIIDTDATCTEAGSKHQVCSVCSSTIKIDSIDAYGHSVNVIAHPTTCVEMGFDEYYCEKCSLTTTKSWEEISCNVSIDHLGEGFTGGGMYHIYSLNVNFTGGGSEYFDSDAYITIYDLYGTNISYIISPSCVKYNGKWSITKTVYLLYGWEHSIYINIDTTAGGVTCYCDVSNNTCVYYNNPAHKYESVVTEPTKTQDGYTTHICSICGDSYVDAYTDAVGSTGLEYAINEDGTTCAITGIGTCKDENVYIPTAIDGYSVTVIGEKAFAGCANIKSIHISKTVTNIANKAFYKCAGITEIKIPANVEYIGSQIFLGCESLSTVYYNASYAPPEGETFIRNEGLKKIVFGDNLTQIPSYICYNCDNLEEIILSPNTQYIGAYAFYYCTSVREIELPEGLINTGWYAFYGMNITELIIPDTVESIYNSFRDCRSLEKIVLPVSVISIPDQTFYLCPVKEVYYTGDALEWSAISIGIDSLSINDANVYFYSESQPEGNGNFWHYVDGIPFIW